MCTIEVSQAKITALINTGASVNVIDSTQFDKLSPQPQLQPTKAKIYTYGGTEPIPLRGVIHITVENEGQSTNARFHVM